MALSPQMIRLYNRGSSVTALVIGTGNIFCGIGEIIRQFSDNTIPITFLNFWVYTTVGFGKGFIYGMIWPAFVPYALGKSVFKDPHYVRVRTYGSVNENGLMPHFIPLWSVKK